MPVKMGLVGMRRNIARGNVPRAGQLFGGIVAATKDRRMKTWPSALYTAAALMILPLAITACDRKTETKETKIIKEAAPAPAPVHETTIINERAPAPVVHDTTVIKEDRTVVHDDHNTVIHDDRDHDHDHH
jgi:hypothetical protein